MSANAGDLADLYAGLLERLAREQDAASSYRTIFGHEHPQHAGAIATTRGEAARAVKALYGALAMGDPWMRGAAMAHLFVLQSQDPITSDTLRDEWAAAWRAWKAP